jgi:hypothetical protein
MEEEAYMPEETEAMEEEMAPEMREEDAPEELPAGTVLSQSVDEIPELADVTIGDVVSFEITDISDDGVYELTYAVEPPVPSEELPSEEAVGGGREAVIGALR